MTMTGKELCSLMRKHKVTIKELAKRTQITMKRIREVRAEGLKDEDAIRDWKEAITGEKCESCKAREAQLFDAAADLLVACKAMYLACATDAVRRLLGKEYDKAFGMARDAIAKAERK